MVGATFFPSLGKLLLPPHPHPPPLSLLEGWRMFAVSPAPFVCQVYQAATSVSSTAGLCVYSWVLEVLR